MLVKCVLRAVAMILISEDVIPPGQEIVPVPPVNSHKARQERRSQPARFKMMKTVGPKARGNAIGDFESYQQFHGFLFEVPAFLLQSFGFSRIFKAKLGGADQNWNGILSYEKTSRG